VSKEVVIDNEFQALVEPRHQLTCNLLAKRETPPRKSVPSLTLILKLIVYRWIYYQTEHQTCKVRNCLFVRLSRGQLHCAAVILICMHMFSRKAASSA